MSLTSLSELEAEPPAPLYPKLRPHPHGPPREEIERNQRKRLKGAMIEAVAQHGYRATSVAELTRLAGVSKRTFYEQYPNKGACFLATYDSILERATSAMGAARRGEPSWRDGVQSAVETLAQAIAQQPKATWLVLVGVYGAGAPALARHAAAREALGRGLGYGFDAEASGASLPPAVALGMVYGLERVVRRRLLDGAEQELPELADELARWMRSYGSAAVAELASCAPVVTKLGATGGSPMRPHAGGERAGILRAAAELIARGYVQLTPAQIVEHASVSPSAFERLYGTVDECLLDVLDLVGVEALIAAGRAVQGSSDPYEGVVRGLVALIGHMTYDPVLRKVIVVHAMSTGSAAAVGGERLLRRFSAVFTGQLPSVSRPSEIVIEAAVGAVWGLIHHYLECGLDNRLPEITGFAAYLALAPLIGADAAVDAIVGGATSLCPAECWAAQPA
jgi:AcrR family transcriptional regulator